MFDLNVTQLALQTKPEQIASINSEFTIPIVIGVVILISIISLLVGLGIVKGSESKKKIFIIWIFTTIISSVIIAVAAFLPNTIVNIISKFTGGLN